MYVQRNNEARSYDHCCIGKAISIHFIYGCTIVYIVVSFVFLCLIF